MTENEAKEYIRSRICNEKGIQRLCRDNCMYGEGQCAFQIAIKALEEIQEEKVILKSINDELKVVKKEIEKRIAELEQYRAIGSMEELKALKEKSVAKKPIIHGLGQRYCPVCKCGGADHFYCARCGQKLG